MLVRNRPSLSSSVVPQDYLCHAETEYFNGCVLFLTDPTSPFPTHSPVRCSRLLEIAASRLLRWVTIPCCTAAELLTSQYRLFRLKSAKLKKKIYIKKAQSYRKPDVKSHYFQTELQMYFCTDGSPHWNLMSHLRFTPPHSVCTWSDGT